MLAGVRLGGAAPLYSAHLGHLRLVSVDNDIHQYGRNLRADAPKRTHVANLTAVPTTTLGRNKS